MLQQVKTAPFAPESNRDRLLHYKYTSIRLGDGEYNGPVSWEFIKECIEPLEESETYTCYRFTLESSILSVIGGNSISADIRETDHRFWDIFDFDFIYGKPYTKDDYDTHSATAVVCESVAKNLFGTADAVGREMTVDGIPYKITGVVKDVSSLATTAYAQAWTNVTRGTLQHPGHSLFGMLSATILAKTPENREAVREELIRRIAELNKRYQAENREIILRGRPYTQEVDALNAFCNVEPDLESAKKKRYTVFLVLLIVPAINLLSMTQSRLRQRTSEIAIRRAFGRQRISIIIDLLFENLLLTLVAGFIGLILSIGFAYGFDTYLFAQKSNYAIDTTASFSELLHWSTFGLALLFCFILNILSNSIPAWKASRTSITAAISGKVK